jgi:hypothetical protein
MYKINVVPDPSSEGNARRIILDTVSGERIHQRAVWGCERCENDVYVPHFTCMYAGKAMGHSESHCTANACY